MPEENIELHRRVVDAFNRRDVERMLTLYDPQIELHSAVTASVYHGHAGVRRWNRDLEEAFGEAIRIEPQAYFDLGEHTITFHLLHGRGRSSGVDVAEAFAHVHRWRNGLTVWFKAFADQVDALNTLGIAQDAVERIDP